MHDHTVQTSVLVSLAMTTPLMFLADLLVRVLSTVAITVVTSLVVGFINRRFAPPASPSSPDVSGSQRAQPVPPKKGTDDR